MTTTKPPLSLAVETSGRRGSIALGRGPVCIDEVGFATDRERARDLLPAIDSLVRKHADSPRDIDRCDVSVGPGSFTGLRVAVTFARHLALATGAKLVAVPTMECIAQNARLTSPPPKRAIVLLRARRDRVFAAAYRWEGKRFACETLVRMVALTEFLAEAGADESAVVLGEGAAQDRDVILATGAIIAEEDIWHPQARVVHELGWHAAEQGMFVAPQDLIPLYVRRPEAEEVWERRAAASNHDL